MYIESQMKSLIKYIHLKQYGQHPALEHNNIVYHVRLAQVYHLLLLKVICGVACMSVGKEAE